MNAIEGKLYSPFLKESRKLAFTSNQTFEYETKQDWERSDATVSKIRISNGFPIKSFRDLVEEVAIVTLNNRNYEMFYRGQTIDYKDSQGNFYKSKTPKTIIYPTICRPDRKANDTYKASIRKTHVSERYKDLKRMIELSSGGYFQLDEYYLSLFQHYEILPTPFIDITQSLRVAATFALRNSSTGFLYVFGLPFPNGSISYYVDQGIVLIKLQNVCPPSAYRPRYQEGYLVGKYPVRPTKEASDNLARRLVAKFYLDNTENKFWDKNFTSIPEDVLFPKDDTFEKQLNDLKEKFLKEL